MDPESADVITLAFDLAALEELADPSAVVSDAREWANYVGVVSDEPTYVVTNFMRENVISHDFTPGSRSKRESLQAIRHQPEFDADRYVLIGVDESDEHEQLATEFGWEYFTVEEVADEAGWSLRQDTASVEYFEDDDHDTWP